MQTEFALKATQAMSEAWWFSEAEQHASLLKERIDPKGSNRTWTVPPEFQFEAQIALANLSYRAYSTIFNDQICIINLVGIRNERNRCASIPNAGVLLTTFAGH